MTTIACWFNNENEHSSIWVCGDSKVSASNAATLIESSPKIFSIPVRCFEASASGFFDTPVLNATIGLAYAGNSLVALTLNSALTSCLAHLNSIQGLPSLDEIAAFALKLLQLYVEQLGATSGTRAFCELAIAGFCPVERRHKVYHLTPTIELSELKYQLTTYPDGQADDFVLLLGSDKERIATSINKFRQQHERNIAWWRAPKSVISNEVKEPQHPTIGGHLQLGIGNMLGFQVYSVCQPSGTGATAHLSYLGLNVSSDFGQIGSSMIGMPGMV